MISSVELVKNSYPNHLLGSETLAKALGYFRNIAFDAIEFSDLAKYNFMNYAAGNATHPAAYEWVLR